jgi:hypothetical protein
MQRLARDGWLVERPTPPPAKKWWSVAKPLSIWRRPHPRGAPTLVMSYPGGSPEPSLARIAGNAPCLPAGFGGYGVRFWVESDDDAPTPLEDATWADWDQRGRLVLTRAGRLFAAEITPTAIGPLRELADFTELEPNPQPSPEWARSWDPPAGPEGVDFGPDRPQPRNRSARRAPAGNKEKSRRRTGAAVRPHTDARSWRR